MKRQDICRIGAIRSVSIGFVALGASLVGSTGVATAATSALPPQAPCTAPFYDGGCPVPPLPPLPAGVSVAVQTGDLGAQSVPAKPEVLSGPLPVTGTSLAPKVALGVGSVLAGAMLLGLSRLRRQPPGA